MPTVLNPRRALLSHTNKNTPVLLQEHMLIFMCVYIQVCSTCVGTGTCVCGTQRSTSDVTPQVKSTLCCETRSLTETQSSQIWLEQPDSEPQEPSASASPALGLQVRTNTAGFLHGGWRLRSGPHICGWITSPASHRVYTCIDEQFTSPVLSCKKSGQSQILAIITFWKAAMLITIY